MADRVKLSATLPKADTQMNGLDTLANQLINRPAQMYYAVVALKRAKLVIDDKRGMAQQPEVEIVQIEGLDQIRDVELATMLLERAATRRNGTDPDQLDIPPVDLDDDDLVDLT